MKNSQHPISCIIAATDFSEVGEQAALRGALIAKHLNKKLHLLHVVHPLDLYPKLMVSFDSHAKDYERLKEANGMEKLDSLSKKIQKGFGVKVETTVRIGRVHVQISKYAKEHPSSLVVAGYRGENTISDLMMGSTAFRLLRTANFPVLIIRNLEILPYKQAVAAVDLTEGSSSIPALACKLAPDASIELLHVFDVEQESRSRDVGVPATSIKEYRERALTHVIEQLDDMVESLDNPRVSRKVLTGYLPEEICSRTAQLNADLIVLGRQGKSGAQEFMLGSVSKSVASMVSCDVLLS